MPGSPLTRWLGFGRPQRDENAPLLHGTIPGRAARGMCRARPQGAVRNAVEHGSEAHPAAARTASGCHPPSQSGRAHPVVAFTRYASLV